MKKLFSILLLGVMLTGVLGSANATFKQWTGVENTKLGGNRYNVSHSINGFNAGYDWLESHNTILMLRNMVGNYMTKVELFSNRIDSLYKKNGAATFRVGDKFGGKEFTTNLVERGYQGGEGGGNNAVPEPGMLALMALVLLGLGLGPWLRKIHTR